MTELVTLGMVILGMWGAFYLGSRRQEEKLFESNKTFQPETIGFEEPDEETYNKQIEEWKRGENAES